MFFNSLQIIQEIRKKLTLKAGIIFLENHLFEQNGLLLCEEIHLIQKMQILPYVECTLRMIAFLTIQKQNMAECLHPSN